METKVTKLVYKARIPEPMQKCSEAEQTINNFFKGLPHWNIEEETGYTPKTTFWMDFSIADKFGIPAIIDTAKRSFKEWRYNYEYLTELSLVLNHKIWEWYERQGETSEKARVYDKLWRKVQDWAYDNLKGEELSYYTRTIN